MLMQASNKYKNEFDCLQNIVKSDDLGFIGLFSRGLGPTLAREVPSYGIYFLIYGLLMSLPVATAMGNMAPLIFGAFTGMVRLSCHFVLAMSFSVIFAHSVLFSKPRQVGFLFIPLM